MNHKKHLPRLLGRGHKEAVKGIPFLEGDIADVDHVEQVIRGCGISAIMHFAVHSQLGESVRMVKLR